MDKSVLNTPRSAHETDDFQEVLEIIKEMMGDLHDTAAMSAQLNELDISDEWAENIRGFLQSPVESSYSALRSIEKSIVDMIQDRFFEFIRTKRHLIESAFLVSDNSLHYAIILEEDTIESEAEILEFKMDYYETPVAKRFPLIISFLRPDHLEETQIAYELDLG